MICSFICFTGWGWAQLTYSYWFLYSIFLGILFNGDSKWVNNTYYLFSAKYSQLNLSYFCSCLHSCWLIFPRSLSFLVLDQGFPVGLMAVTSLLDSVIPRRCREWTPQCLWLTLGRCCRSRLRSSSSLLAWLISSVKQSMISERCSLQPNWKEERKENQAHFC